MRKRERRREEKGEKEVGGVSEKKGEKEGGRGREKKSQKRR